ncbi:superinfection immunity protein [Candidatus Woesearchaeota archaeon]|nr:superinfection immunity protein [Candidatus Woesearchaeota archaeon]
MPILTSALATLGALYFLPTIIAGMKKKKNIVDILLFNTFLGWTIIGWLAAMAWAVYGESSLPFQEIKKKKLFRRKSILDKWLFSKREL